MIAFTIALTWLTLAAGGFAALSALGRRERDLDRERAFLEPDASAFGDTWHGLSGAGAR